MGVPCPPFYRPRGSRDYRWEKEEKIEGREGHSKELGLPSPCACPPDKDDRVRDGVFTDPDRVALGLHSASGHVPSHSDGRRGALGC